MSERRIPGSARVTRRAVAEIVRAAVLESYGVTGLSDADLMSRIRRWLGLRRALGRELDSLLVHVGGLDYRPAAPSAPPAPTPGPRADAGPLLDATDGAVDAGAAVPHDEDRPPGADRSSGEDRPPAAGEGGT
jgi:hypothetical protein